MKAFVIADASKRKAKPVGALFWQPDSTHEQGCFSLELASWCTEADLPLSLVFGLSRPARCATATESEMRLSVRTHSLLEEIAYALGKELNVEMK